MANALYNFQGLKHETVFPSGFVLKADRSFEAGQALTRCFSVLSSHNYRFVEAKGKFSLEKQHISTAKRVGYVFLAILLLPLTLLGLAIGSALLHKSPTHKCLVAFAQVEELESEANALEARFTPQAQVLEAKRNRLMAKAQDVELEPAEQLALQDVDKQIAQLQADVTKATTKFEQKGQNAANRAYQLIAQLPKKQAQLPAAAANRDTARGAPSRPAHVPPGASRAALDDRYGPSGPMAVDLHAARHDLAQRTQADDRELVLAPPGGGPSSALGNR